MNHITFQQQAAQAFAQRWQGKGYEKGESQLFWTELLCEVFGVKEPSNLITFEGQVHLDHTSFIDAYIRETHVMIEQKSLGKNLRAKIRQSDGSELTPFEQAKRYATELPYSLRPRWIVTCNFQEFNVYDMESPQHEPEVIYLKDLEKEFYRLQFLVASDHLHLQKELEVSMKAGEIVGRIYDALVSEYDLSDPLSLRYLNILCVRLVFCLYAEDAGIFGKRDQFHDFLAHYPAEDMRHALLSLFETLNTPVEKRSRYLKPDLAAFPYTNGGLFAEEIDIPQFTTDIRETLLQHASLDFDWSEISPTIFGGVFESTLNPVTRRSGGMHYTSIENIHKVIDPLFLDDLKDELQKILQVQQVKKRCLKLHAYQDKLASLRFFDPACGSGNFLTETYLSLRRLENRLIQALYSEEEFDAFTNPIKVNIHQFYGIEINDFAVTVATTALWISEAQMMAETERIIHHDIDFLPLKSYANIHEGNSLTMEWGEVIGLSEGAEADGQGLYIIGNPPFVGRRYRSPEQTAEVNRFFKYKDIDYVACWYKKADEMIADTDIQCAFVSTNSITQGEQVPALWSNMKSHINFAYRTFRWDSEASQKAHVFCVIIGFGRKEMPNKKLYDGDKVMICKNINGYLLDAPNVYVTLRSKPLCNVPLMKNGNVPLDGDALKVEAEDVTDFADCPHLIRRLVGGRELLHREARYVLWLVGVSPSEIKRFPKVYERVCKCRDNRLAMKDKGTQKLANTPTTFRDTNNPDDYIALPMVSSEKREYLPMDYLHGDTIPTNQVQIIPSATLYHFAVLESSVHMAWMRAVCGRLKSDYRYSKDVVYNNFPWPEGVQERLSATAQAILDARALYPDSSLADLYDPVLMPPELRKAHRENDRAVLQAYGWRTSLTEQDIVARLFERYEEMVKG